LSKDAAHAALRGTLSDQKNELLFARYGINYAHLPVMYRRGTTLLRGASKGFSAAAVLFGAAEAERRGAAMRAARRGDAVAAQLAASVSPAGGGRRGAGVDGPAQEEPAVVASALYSSDPWQPQPDPALGALLAEKAAYDRRCAEAATDVAVIGDVTLPDVVDCNLDLSGPGGSVHVVFPDYNRSTFLADVFAQVDSPKGHRGD
jgi:hypothetical protein